MKSRSLFCLYLLLAVLPIVAQEGFSLQAETARLREQISTETASATKHILLAELAELLKLSGDNENAATVWHDAAYAVPGERDDRALLESAVCYMAMGEWETADSAVRLVLITGRAGSPLFVRARYLSAQIEAFTRGNVDALLYLAADPDYASQKASIYYTLYMTTKDTAYRVRLRSDFPDSPEARLTEGTAAFPGAMWLLYPGRDSIVIER
jgi:hypothetical protein